MKKDTKFQKGIIPHNKGQKMPESTYAKLRPTMFQKGHKITTEKPIGYERVDKDGYIEIKTAQGFRRKQRYLWEQAHGKVPPKHIVIFLDGDNRNFDLNNLGIIGQAENMSRNRIIYSPEYKEVLLLLKQLKSKIDDAKKHIGGLA